MSASDPGDRDGSGDGRPGDAEGAGGPGDRSEPAAVAEPEDGAEPTSADAAADETAAADTWRFSLDDVDEDGIVRPPMEPGSPAPENVFFVLVGVVGTLLVLFVGI